MERRHNIVLFGPPGVGKSTIGEVFRDHFGYSFYEGDDEMTTEERDLVSKGLWGDVERRKLLIRMGCTIRGRFEESKKGLVTSVALTREWMRGFLNEQAGGNLEFVLVTTKLQQSELENLVLKRREAGHAITVESFRKFTSAFEPPQVKHLVLENPQDETKKRLLIGNVEQVLSTLNK